MAGKIPKGFKDELGRANFKQLENFEKSLKKMKEVTAKVGILRNSKLAKIASYQEYGTATIPARSFIRFVEDRYSKRFINKAYKNLLDWLVNKKKLKHGLTSTTIAIELDMAAEIIEARMIKRIFSNIKPRLKPATIRAKERKFYILPKVALIGTGALVNGISRAIYFKSRNLNKHLKRFRFR